MKQIQFTILLALAFFSSASHAAPIQIVGLYVNTFGDIRNQALIFVHGGPGYNSWDFELTTAPALADKGYFVVVYDQRGQGRSETLLNEGVADSKQYSYQKYAEDLKSIIDSLHLTQPILLGHSHGGPISVKFDQAFPHVAKSIVLISAPLNFWGSMQSILQNCSARYSAQNDQKNVSGVSYVYGQLFLGPELPIDQKIQMVGATFYFGMSCGLYDVSKPTQEGARLHQLLREKPIEGAISAKSPAMPGFLSNENYVHFNGLEYAYENRSRFCGIYGNQDGLFTPLELGVIKNAIQGPGEPERFKIINGASHAVYMDQQETFFETLRGTCGI